MKLRISEKTGEPGQFRISMSRSSDSTRPTVHLGVEETLSGQRLLDVYLTAEELLYLLGGGIINVQSNPIPHPHRIGKQLEIGSATVAPRSSPSVRRLLIQRGWDEVSIRPQNDGKHHVVAYKWRSPIVDSADRVDT